VEEVNSSLTYLIYGKNFCKCHSTTTTQKERKRDSKKPLKRKKKRKEKETVKTIKKSTKYSPTGIRS
jgi:hypothetical protein